MRKGLAFLTARVLLVASFALPISSSTPLLDVANAANPSCSPEVSSTGKTRVYAFVGVGACDWTIPAGWGTFTFEISGGGGGGGGGSWSGSTGGGGGGGGLGSQIQKNLSKSPGTQITIQVGAGGDGGLGAASQGSATGLSGGDGGLTRMIFSTADSYTALGGGGGSGANGDTGGAGGAGAGLNLASYSLINAPLSGSSQNSGNGGAGKLSADGFEPATATNPSYSYIQGMGVSTFQRRKGGAGGARTGTQQAVSKTGNSSDGADSTSAAQVGLIGSGSGGGGGAGCSAASLTCANRNGAAGASGYVLIYGSFSMGLLNQNTTSSDPALNTSNFAVGIAPTFPTLASYRAIGSVNWTVSPALPPGLSLDATTGTLSGVPTTVTARKSYAFTATDNYGSTSDFNWPLLVDRASGAGPTFTGSNIVFGVATALIASGGGGTGEITFKSSSADCVLSGTRGETVTAQKATGSCTIIAQKAADANYFSGSTSASFTMTKQVATISIAASPSSPKEEGTTVAITATLGSGQTGTVTFYKDGAPITSCGNSGVVNIVGTSASCNWISTASGSPNALTATYSGDSNYQNATSNSISYTINPSILLSYPGISTTFGTAKTATPSISGGTGSSSSWTWQIARHSDSASVSGISISSSGVVTASASTAVGNHVMRVSVTDSAGISKTALITVGVGLSTSASPTIATAENSMTAGGTVHLTATVISAATGTFNFKVGAATIAGCSAVVISSGTASCDWVTTTSSGSPFSVTAVYSGDGNYASVTSSAISIAVVPKGSFTYSSVTSTFGSETSITPIISGGTGNFSSWSIVQTSDSNTVVGIDINTSGVITIARALPAGSYQMSVGATDQLGVTGSGSVTITITQATTSVVLSVRTITNVELTAGTLGRQVRVVATFNVPISGPVTIYGNGSSICTPFASVGTAECWWAPANAASSPYSLYATFGGNSSATAATSNTVSSFAWNPEISLSYLNATVESGKSLSRNPSVSGGTGSVSTWSWVMFQEITGNSIGGININGSGVVTVSGAVKPDTYTMSITAYDPTGANRSTTLTLVVTSLVAPDISLNVASETGTVGASVTGFLITNSGSDVDYYSIDLNLPSGLSFDTMTGVISGTPSETVTSLLLTITANNFVGSDTATFTLTINPSAAPNTVTISLAGGAVVTRGALTVITATISKAGSVRFLENGRTINGCSAKSGISSATCTWRPKVHGGSVALSAKFTPSGASVVTSNVLSVAVTRRTGNR